MTATGLQQRGAPVPEAARAAALALPVAVPVAMRVIFPALASRLGQRRGYLAGFGVYWATCVAVPLATLGRRRSVALMRRPAPLPRRARGGAAIALLVPPLGGFATELVPELRRAERPLVAAAVAIATVNATAEELLWRALPLTAFPKSRLAGWLWPAVGFGLWHAAPLAVRPASKGNGRFLAAATALGLSYGWAARRTDSLVPGLASHIATDATGLRAYRFWLGRADAADYKRRPAINRREA
jgi:membrane protease YdiL (CAAX protease family)